MLQGISYEEACANFWILDADGLITIKRETVISETVKPFARKTQEDVEGNSLVETVRQVSSLLCSFQAHSHEQVIFWVLC